MTRLAWFSLGVFIGMSVWFLIAATAAGVYGPAAGIAVVVVVTGSFRVGWKPLR